MENDHSLIRCPNCGAEHSIHLPKCPYCGTINPEGAEEAYLDKLEQTRQDLDEVDDLAKQEVRSEVKAGAGKAVKRVILAAVILLVLAGVYLLTDRILSGGRSEYELTEQEIAWQREAFPELDRLYEAGDLEAAAGRLQEYSAQNHRVWDWSHYTFLEWYDNYRRTQEHLQELTEKQSCSELLAGLLVFGTFRFYYRDYAPEQGVSLSEGDIARLDGYREELVTAIHDRLGFTDEQMEAFRADVYDEYNVLNYKKCEKLGKQYRGSFR